MTKLKANFNFVNNRNTIYKFLFIFLLSINFLSLIKSERVGLDKTANSKKFIGDLHGNQSPYYTNNEYFLNNDYSDLDREEDFQNAFNASNTKSSDYKISSMSQIFTFDVSKSSCDINVKENVNFKLAAASNTIDYIIISKKTPLYGFGVNINMNMQNANATNDKQIFIQNFKLMQDSSFRQRLFIDTDGRRLSFRDRWLLSVQVSQPVKEINLELVYYMQRALLIDSISEVNYLKFILINPQDTIEDYTLVINLDNFENLKAENLKVPIESLITTYKNNAQGKNGTNIKIETKRPYEKHTEYEINLSLPYAVSSCEGNIVNIVYYGLIGMSVLFIIMSLTTLTYLYKE